MNLGDEVIGIGRDHRKRPNPLAGRRLFPVLPYPADAEWRAVLHGYGVRLLCSLSLDRLPLEESVHRHDAAAFAVRVPERRQRRDSLAFGVDRLVEARRRAVTMNATELA